MAEGGVSQGALATALASLDDAALRQDVAALLARDSEQLLCASPAPSNLWQERSSDIWELARLRMRSETLAADNEQLRGQVLQLSARVDKLTCEAQAAHGDAQAQRLVVHELAADRCAELEAALEQQRRAVEALQAAAHEATAENCALRREAAALREGHALAAFKAKALQERAHTLEELYMQASRAAEREGKQQHAAAALCALQQIHAAELAVIPSTDAGGEDGDTTRLLEADPPQQLVPALQQMAALRRERDALAKQVKKGEERVRGLEGEREAALRAQAAAQRAQRSAADAAQSRALGLARRVNYLAGQLKAKEDLLGQKAAYIAKLELQLLNKHRALDAVPKVGKFALQLAARPGPAPQANISGLQRSKEGANKQPPQAVQPAAQRAAGHMLQPTAGAGMAAQPRRPLVPRNHNEIPTDNDAKAYAPPQPAHAEKQHTASAGSTVGAARNDTHACQPAGGAVRTPAPAPEDNLGGGPCMTPDAPCSSYVSASLPVAPTAVQQRPTPTYVSRAQHQHLEAPAEREVDSKGRAADDRRPQLPAPNLHLQEASPAVSEMVYELRTAFHPRALVAVARASPFGQLSDTPSARQRYGQAGFGQQANDADSAAGGALLGVQREQERPMQVPSLTRATTSDLVEFASMGGPSRSGQASGTEDGAPADTSALPAYSGFSAEMRAAANAAAEVLLAETGSDSVSFCPRASSKAGTSSSAAVASMRSSTNFGDQSVATYSLDQTTGRGKGGSPEGAQDQEECLQAWEGSEACRGGGGERERLPLEELERRIQQLHGAEGDSRGNALACASHRHGSTDDQLHELDDLARDHEQRWVPAAAGPCPDVLNPVREQAEVNVDAHIRAVCAVGSMTFKKDRGYMQRRGSQSVFPTLAQQPQDAEKCSGADMPFHLPGPVADRVKTRQRLDFDAPQG